MDNRNKISTLLIYSFRYIYCTFVRLKNMKTKKILSVVICVLALWILFDDSLLLSVMGSLHNDKTANCLNDSGHNINWDRTLHFFNECKTSTKFAEITAQSISILNDFCKISFVLNSIWQPPELVFA